MKHMKIKKKLNVGIYFTERKIYRGYATFFIFLLFKQISCIFL